MILSIRRARGPARARRPAAGPALTGCVATLWLAMAGPVAAQQPVLPPGEAILAQCGAAAQAGDQSAADAAAQRADSMASVLESEQPVEALVLRAQIISRCRIPFANLMRQGALVEDSNGLLQRALQRDATHLGALWLLGMNHYHTPEFVGRTDDAIAAFETLLEHHGAVRDPRIADAYLFLGNLYERTRQLDRAQRTWDAGAARFPEHAGLKAKVRTHDPPPASARMPGRSRPGQTGPDSVPQDSLARRTERGTTDAPRHDFAPIIVEAGSYSIEDARTATRITRLEVYTLPGGAADVLQSFQTMPGVTRVNDGVDLYVRGGDPAEAPIYVDGTRLFYPGRFETLSGSVFGVLDPSAMRRAYFSSGGFSARYGNALSGIVDITTEGRPVESQWRVGANLSGIGGTLWLPTTAETGVWGTGMLTSTWPLITLHGRQEEYPASPSSAQAMAGAVWAPDANVEVKASALLEADRTKANIEAAGHDGVFESDATTQLASASLRVVGGGGRRMLRVSAGASTRTSGFAFGVLDREREDRAANLRIDAEVMRGRLRLRGGAEYARVEARRNGTVPATEAIRPGSPVVVLVDEGEHATHLGVYGEVEAQLAQRVALVAGLRADELPGESAWILDPRLAVAYRANDWTLRLGGGLFSQGRWRVGYALPDGGRPAGVPLRARHLVAGVQRAGRLSVRAEAYTKRYSGYDDAVLGLEPAAPASPRAVAGRARGLDLLLQWAGTDRITGWLTYSLLDAEIELADGRRARATYDVTHTATAVVKLSIGTSWEWGVTTRYATGRPYTPILGLAPPGEGRPASPWYGGLHEARYPEYFRVDARITRLLPLAGGMIVLYLEALNVLDRPNVVGYTYDETYRERRTISSFFGDRTLVFGTELRF